MRPTKLFFFAAGLVVFASAQDARPALAGGAVEPQSASYSQRGVISPSSGATAKTCYPLWGQCTKDSDCCTGYCRVGRVSAYCDYGK
jgi:hypothetical protein